jgi:hypothetical protein
MSSYWIDPFSVGGTSEFSLQPTPGPNSARERHMRGNWRDVTPTEFSYSGACDPCRKANCPCSPSDSSPHACARCSDFDIADQCTAATTAIIASTSGRSTPRQQDSRQPARIPGDFVLYGDDVPEEISTVQPHPFPHSNHSFAVPTMPAYPMGLPTRVEVRFVPRHRDLDSLHQAPEFTGNLILEDDGHSIYDQSRGFLPISDCLSEVAERFASRRWCSA